MNFRFRSLAASLLMLTLSLTVAEGLWASTCMQGMEMAGGATMVMGGVAEHVDDGHQRENPGEHSRELPHCPLVPASGSCIALATSLPAHVPANFAPSPESAPAVVSTDDALSILLVSPFFHPPRA